MIIHRIGDPHIGRSFVNGTPINRKGDREVLQLSQFEKELFTSCALNVMMGDIFDKAIVSPSVVMEVYNLYIQAAQALPDTTFILIKGNHDVSRDVNKKSSFDLLALMLATQKNIIIVHDHYVHADKLLFISYNAFTDSVTYTKSILAHYGLSEYQEAFGHWDTVSYGGDDHNLLPYEVLSGVTEHVSTGHIHLPDKFEKLGLNINVVGSLQPYSHAEDENSSLYVTVTVEEYEQDPSIYKNKCLRLLIKPEEEIPEGIDCLQFTYKVIKSEEEEALEVTMGDFDFKGLLYECLENNGVPESDIEKVWRAYNECE